MNIRFDAIKTCASNGNFLNAGMALHEVVASYWGKRAYRIITGEFSSLAERDAGYLAQGIDYALAAIAGDEPARIAQVSAVWTDDHIGNSLFDRTVREAARTYADGEILPRGHESNIDFLRRVVGEALITVTLAPHSEEAA